MNKSFLALFFKKEQEKTLLFEKRSKNFCSFGCFRRGRVASALADFKCVAPRGPRLAMELCCIAVSRPQEPPGP
jgi:hypothetical protein